MQNNDSNIKPTASQMEANLKKPARRLCKTQISAIMVTIMLVLVNAFVTLSMLPHILPPPYPRHDAIVVILFMQVLLATFEVYAGNIVLAMIKNIKKNREAEQKT